MGCVESGSLNCQNGSGIAAIGSVLKTTAVLLLFIWNAWKCPQTIADISCINPPSLWNSASTNVRNTSKRCCLTCAKLFCLIDSALMSHRWSIRRQWWPWDPWPSTRRGQRSLTSPCPLWRPASAWWCPVATGPCLRLPSSVTFPFVFFDFLESFFIFNQVLFQEYKK